MQPKGIKNLIIGFGKAGKTLAAFLANKNEEVILVEKSPKMYGGTCINVGCIPSKSLITKAGKEIQLPKAVETTNELTSKLRKANYDKVEDLSDAKVITGTAKFIDNQTVEVSTESGKELYLPERIFINTGAKPRKLEIKGADLPQIYDSTSIMQLTKLPQKLCIVGGGFIGLEFASMFADFGSSVTILDAGDEFLPREDADMKKAIQEVLDKKNISIKTSVKTQEFITQNEQVLVKTENEEILADAVLVAIGRVPNTEELGLENTDIQLNERGFIQVNDELKTSVENIWALGDCNGGPQFTYISLDDFRLVKNQLFGGDYTKRSQRKDFATSVFISPAYAHIGKKENEIENKNEVIVKLMPANSIPKAKILQETDGLLKAIIDKKTNKILGCTLFCAEAHELINIVKTAVDNDLKAEVLANQIYTHPTMAEAFNDLFG